MLSKISYLSSHGAALQGWARVWAVKSEHWLAGSNKHPENVARAVAASRLFLSVQSGSPRPSLVLALGRWSAACRPRK